MKLTPRYGSDPIVTLDGPPDAIAEPAIRQRRRLGEVLATLDEAQWAQPSRCAGWSVRDVIVHLDSTNAFWGYSIHQGLKGEPSRLMADFDPVASPAALVADAPHTSGAELAARFAESTEALCGQIESLSSQQWLLPAEAPIGHVSVSAVVHHALWDSWVHERDVLLPLGMTPVEEPDEVAATLRYASSLGPAFSITNDAALSAQFGVAADNPEVSFTVDVGAAVVVHEGLDADTPRLTGSAVALLEALSLRSPFEQPLPDELAWIMRGLTETFDAT